MGTAASRLAQNLADLFWMTEWIFRRFCRTRTNSISCASSRFFSSSSFSFCSETKEQKLSEEAEEASEQRFWYLQPFLLTLEQDVLQRSPALPFVLLLPLHPLPPLQHLLKLRPAAQHQAPASSRQAAQTRRLVLLGQRS